ncbi:glycosyltransferase family 2 protein [Microbacterium sp. 1P10AE]|uniref:glycosyltransferase family 2 protein n=1 Tax=Microbacterium sp. 1P10AE TaxID=3132286 RepID=UPI0039A21D02
MTSSSHRATVSVTCVVPTHDRDDLAYAAVRSILAQTHLPERVVVVDDTGRDPDRSSLRQILDTGAGLVELRDASGLSHPGASRSRNIGAEGAASEFLAFLDDDDVWEATYLEKMTAALDLEPAASMAVAWGSLERDGVVREHNWRAPRGKSARDVVADNPGVTGSNFVIRRTAFERVGGFDPQLWVFNDLDFLVRFLDSGLLYTTVEEDLVRQRVAAGEHLSTRSERRARGIAAYREKHKDLLGRRQRRRLRREVHIANLYAGQTPLKRARHLAGVLANTTPSHFSAAVMRRVLGQPGYD